MDLMELVDLVEVAHPDKLASEEHVSATATVLPNSVVLISAEMTVENVFQDKHVSTISALDLAHHNVLEPLTGLPRPAVGTDVVETVEVAHPDTVAKTESVCAIPNALPEIVDLMVVEEPVEHVPLMPSATATQLMLFMEHVTSNATSVVMEPARALRLQPLSVLVNSVSPTVLRIVDPLLESSLLQSVKRIN